MYIKTISGSLYEVDEAERRIRRIQGMKKPTPRQGEDGEWRTYTSVNITIGESLFILWNMDGQATITSPVDRCSDKLDDLVTVN